MTSPVQEDPYLALGVAKDATSAAIKSSYRKLVLKCHPDKVVGDDALKQAAADKFHKIQTAYETIGEEDKRSRYDAQCKLAELRKDVLSRQAAAGPKVEVRTAAYKVPTESPGRTYFTAKGPERSERVQVEERRPYDQDYFDRPKVSGKKDYDYERSRRTPQVDERERPRIVRQESRENERVRQREKARQTETQTRRDRDYKYATVEEEEASDSDSELEYERTRRRAKIEEERKAKEAYYEQARRQKEEAARDYYADDRTKKMFANEVGARDYIERSKGARQYSDSERRPSPVRVPSSKDKVEYIKRNDGRPSVMVRRGSGRPRPVAEDRDESPPRREREAPRRASNEYEPRRPPLLSTTKSAPDKIRMPTDRQQRSYSLQTDYDHRDDFQPPPVRRADSMPMQSSRREDPRKPQRASTLRHTEINEGLATPGATPDPTNPNASKYSYGKEYADDYEYPTPNGYRTEVRQPPASSAGRKITRSPSPVREKPSRSIRPGPPSSSRTTSYMYNGSGVEPVRPSLSRSESTRGSSYLYGELPTTSNSPKQRRSKYSPPPPSAPISSIPTDEVRYREIKPEDFRVQTGYSTHGGSRRGSEIRPGYSRSNSQSVFAS